MQHFELPLGVFILQDIETMGTGGDDPFDPVIVETFNIFFHELFKESRFSHPPDLTTTALFFISQYTEVHLSALEIEGKCLGNLLNAGIRSEEHTSELQ